MPLVKQYKVISVKGIYGEVVSKQTRHPQMCMRNHNVRFTSSYIHMPPQYRSTWFRSWLRNWRSLCAFSSDHDQFKDGKHGTDTCFDPVGVATPWHGSPNPAHMCSYRERCGAINGSARCSKWTTLSRTQPQTCFTFLFRVVFSSGRVLLYTCVSRASPSSCRAPIEKSTVFLSIYDARGDCGGLTCPPRVVLGRASREFVYMRRIGSPQSERTSLSVRSLAHFYTQLSAVCSPEAPGTQPQCTQLIATAKSLPFLNINYKSLSSLTPAVTHRSICSWALQHNSLR